MNIQAILDMLKAQREGTTDTAQQQNLDAMSTDLAAFVLEHDAAVQKAADVQAANDTLQQKVDSAAANDTTNANLLAQRDQDIATLNENNAALGKQVAELTAKLGEAQNAKPPAADTSEQDARITELTAQLQAANNANATLQGALNDAQSGTTQRLGNIQDGVYDNNVTRRREKYAKGVMVHAVSESEIGTSAFQLPSDLRGVWGAFRDVPRITDADVAVGSQG